MKKLKFNVYAAAADVVCALISFKMLSINFMTMMLGDLASKSDNSSDGTIRVLIIICAIACLAFNAYMTNECFKNKISFVGPIFGIVAGLFLAISANLFLICGAIVLFIIAAVLTYLQLPAEDWKEYK
ncbi:MAG: hypothetical protein Q3959_05500 [Limosilactobacillus sp.]|uniref:hypothetical protein n=1 Tax=Limosilactobacillus sp. TaxID=2773925 RepID=UPI0026FE4496|nr:hypothetical protein [Limosilactobacillus sp.]